MVAIGFCPAYFPIFSDCRDPRDPRNPAIMQPCIKCKPVKADYQYKSKLQFPLLAILNSFCGSPQDLGCQLRCRWIYKCWKRNFNQYLITLQLLSTMAPYFGALCVAHQNKRAVPSPKIIFTMIPIKSFLFFLS